MSETSRWYPSKIDLWIAIVLTIAPVVCIVAGLAVILASKGSGGSILIGVAPLVFIAAIYLGLVFPMRYGITDDAIIVRHGMVRSQIPFTQISEVSPTHNPLSSPALSLDRLQITYGKGLFKSTMISPADKSAFLDQLALRSGLRREGNHLFRVPTDLPD